MDKDALGPLNVAPECHGIRFSVEWGTGGTMRKHARSLRQWAQTVYGRNASSGNSRRMDGPAWDS
jgi:hypothetical protein